MHFRKTFVYLGVVCNPKIRTTDENEQKNERENANASAKTKELQPNAQADTVAAHLFLPQRTQAHPPP